MTTLRQYASHPVATTRYIAKLVSPAARLGYRLITRTLSNDPLNSLALVERMVGVVENEFSQIDPKRAESVVRDSQEKIDDFRLELILQGY